MFSCLYLLIPVFPSFFKINYNNPAASLYSVFPPHHHPSYPQILSSLTFPVPPRYVPPCGNISRVFALQKYKIHTEQ